MRGEEEDVEKQDPDGTFFDNDEAFKGSQSEPLKTLSHHEPSSTLFECQKIVRKCKEKDTTWRMSRESYIHKSQKRLFMLDLDTDLHSPVGGYAFSHSPGLKDRLLSSTKRQ